ncbi:unnamed protein product [Cuscuta epithymum]|uniref:Uncharacterized protein n=2 Tax=Cuscuta epithymum TaxID=186058 RepID=A0AAV0FC56_9ASTE|nr:unnamed protein product [Cuscuta epithymum]
MSINASHNAIKGRIVSEAQVSSGFEIGGWVDLTFNKLEGSIPLSFFNVTLMYLSHNNFTELTSLCDIKDPKVAAGLHFLDISFNQLSGTLPDCWSSLSSLVVLNLANNHNLSGSLPTSVGSLASLKALHLDRNSFTGTLPSFIKNCSKLVSLHLGHNNFFGPLPDWVGENLPQLAILVLASNHFSASVPTSLCHLQSLQLLDLSMNHLTGSLPKCLSNITQMTIIRGGSATISYEIPLFLIGPAFLMDLPIKEVDKVDTVWKGMLSEFDITLGHVKSIDLSSNMLTGEIPNEITSLVGLISLNISRNNLRGQIPLRIGKIPKGTQLQSFSASAYMGNPGLCGDPLPNSCQGEELTHPSRPRFCEEEEEEEACNKEDADKFLGSEFYASMGVGYAVGFLSVVGTMLFNRSCRFAFFKVFNDFANWVYVVAAIYKAKLLTILRG